MVFTFGTAPSMVKFWTISFSYLLTAASSTALDMSVSSVKINPTASFVLGFKKGGKTDTGCNPLGRRANREEEK